ncbi:MAG: hypothetical protein ACRELZ_20440 [Candidatus Rokuibacteriota bacterium]
MPPIQFAFFTPKQKTGAAHWIDLWSADLFDFESHLQRCNQLDQVEFRSINKTWSDNIPNGGPSGVVQAAFGMPADDFFLGVVKLSRSGPPGASATVQIKIDKKSVGTFTFNSANYEIPVVAELKQGQHRLNVIQKGGAFWFHSITCFQV